MKQVILMACFACAALAAVACAQSPMASRDAKITGKVVVLDMQKLLSDFGPFTESLAAIQHAHEAARQQTGQLKEELQLLEKRRQEYKVDSAPYQRLTDEIVLKEAEIEAVKKQLQWRFDQRRAKLYRDYHQLILARVGEFSKQHDVSLVLNRQPLMAAEDRERDEGERFRHTFVYQRRVDITDNILDQLDELGDAELPSTMQSKQEAAPVAEDELCID